MYITCSVCISLNIIACGIHELTLSICLVIFDGIEYIEEAETLYGLFKKGWIDF